MKLTAAERKENLILMAALDQTDVEKAKMVFDCEELDDKISSTLIQDSLMLPKDHPLKFSNELMMKGLQTLLLKSIDKLEKEKND